MRKFVGERIVLSPSCCRVAAATNFAANLIPFRTTGMITWNQWNFTCFPSLSLGRHDFYFTFLIERMRRKTTVVFREIRMGRKVIFVYQSE